MRAPEISRLLRHDGVLSAGLTAMGGVLLSVLLYLYAHHSCQSSVFLSRSALGRFCTGSGQLGLTLGQLLPAVVAVVGAGFALLTRTRGQRSLVLAASLLGAVVGAWVVAQAIDGLANF